MPKEFLRELGLGDITMLGAPAVRIPYGDVDGEELERSTRYRVSLVGDAPVRSKSNGRPTLYVLDRMHLARDAGFVVLVDGESECHVLWNHDFPAIGVPGASNWRENSDPQALEGVDTVFVVLSRGSGDALLDVIERSGIRDRVWLVRLEEFKDLADLHGRSPGEFRRRVEEARGVCPAVGGVRC